MAIKLIVFDCDGVILESVDVKTKAFGQIVENYGPEAVARMNKYHLAHGGMSRIRKFEWFHREVLDRNFTKDEIKLWSNKFRRLIMEGVMRAPMVSGILETLRFLHGRLNMYVASGTPQDELLEVLIARNLASFFKGIYGSPPGKSELLRRIIFQEDVAASETLMVGDSSTDLEAAQSCGTKFFGIGANFASTPWPFGNDCTVLFEWLGEHFSN